MKYDSDKITGLVSELKSAIKLLKEIASMDYRAFTSDIHRVSSAKYNLIVAIEAAIDISNHLISKNGYRIPEDYADSFRVLAEEKILPEVLVNDRLIKMARFRNRLVHLYWKVDTKILFDILFKDINDLEVFLAELGKSLA